MYYMVKSYFVDFHFSLSLSDCDYTDKSSHMGKLVALHVQTPWLPGKPV